MLGHHAQHVGGVEQLAQHVQLLLFPGRVARTDRSAVGKATHMAEFALEQPALAFHPVHDLHGIAASLSVCAHEHDLSVSPVGRLREPRRRGRFDGPDSANA